MLHVQKVEEVIVQQHERHEIKFANEWATLQRSDLEFDSKLKLFKKHKF